MHFLQFGELEQEEPYCSSILILSYPYTVSWKIVYPNQAMISKINK